MRLFSFIVIFCFSCLANAAFDIQKLNQITASPVYLKGKFEQLKHIADINIDIPSSGKFEYKQGEVVFWHTQKPIDSLLVIRPTSISSKQGDQELVNLNADSNPLVSILSEIFFSVLSAQWQNLEEYFTISGSIEDGRWVVKLIPKNASFSQMIANVNIQGGEYLQELILVQTNGERTAITFHDLSETQ